MARRLFRLFTTRPGLAASIVLTLAVGLGSATAMSSLTYALLLRPLPFPSADRIVAVHADVAGETGRLALREYQEIARAATTFSRVGTYYRTQYNLTGEGPPQAVTCTTPSSSMFDVLGVTPLHGAIWPADVDFTRHHTVVLSHGLWLRRFGGRADVVGQSIVMDGASYRVSGVLPAAVDFPLQTDVYRGASNYNAPHVRRYSVIARLGDGRSLADAQGELDTLSAHFAATWPDTNAGVQLRAVPLRDAYVGRARPFVLSMVCGVALLLLMSAVNVTNLLLTRALSQEGDIAVRLALGAPRWHIVRDSLIETLVLTSASAVLGTLGARAALAAVSRIVAPELPPWMTLDLDPGVLLASAGLSVAVAVAIAWLPARQTLGVDVERVLRQHAGRAGALGSLVARRWLVGVQAAVASVLLVVAGLFAAGLQRLIAVEPGFDRSGVLTFRADPPFTRYPDITTTAEFYHRASETLLTIPGVTHVGTNTNLPFARLDVPSPRIAAEGTGADRVDEAPFVNLQLINPAYFDAMRIPVIRGRRFERTDTEAAPLVAIISERTARRLWADVDPLGRRLQLNWNQDGTARNGGSTLSLEVVGIVGSVRFSGIDDRTGLDVYAPHMQTYAGDTFFTVRVSTRPETIVGQLRAAFDQVDRDQSFFDVMPLDARVARAVWQQRVATAALTLLAAVAFVLAVLGLYAVTAHAVAAQRREIGIRQALGSSGGRIAWLVTRQWLLPAAAGAVIGLGAGAAVADTLTATIGAAAPGPLWPFALPVGLTIGAAVACLVPVVRVWRGVSLTDALRPE